MISFWQSVLFPPSTEKRKEKSLFLDTATSCQCPSSALWAAATHQKFGEGESAAERVGSLDPCSTLTAPPTLNQDLPKASEVRVTRQEPRNPEINGKISTDFRQVSVSSRHTFAADTQISYFIYFNSQLNTFQLTLTPPALLVNWWTTPSCCPAWHYRWTRQSDLP